MAFTVHSHLLNIPLQALPVAAATLDRHGVIVAANHQFVRLSGQGESTGTGQRLSDIVAKPSRPAVEAALSGLTLLDKRDDQTCSIRALRATPPSLRLAIDVTRLGPQSTTHYLACLHEIPRKPRSQNSASKPVAFSVMRKVEPWTPFLMTLSHELRGPLTAIQNWVQVAESGVLPPEKVSRALSVIGRNAGSLSSLIEEMFDLSRHAAGSLALNRQLLDLNPLVQHVVESTLPAARRRNVILSMRSAHSTLLVNGDALRLEQVVRNLVENAIKFTPTGGRVQVQTATDGVNAELVVTDSGLGIAADLLPFVFEPFRQDEASVRPSERGLGLGLTLVRELIALHDGEVRAISEGKGQGSSFAVRLPLASPLKRPAFRTRARLRPAGSIEMADERRRLR